MPERPKKPEETTGGTTLPPTGGGAQPIKQNGRVKPNDFGGYRFLELIGEGGMGEVWAALQEKPVRRKVALKIIKRGMDSRQIVARFEAERQALALMNHANVARVFDAGETADGRPYFAMEYVQGEPITDYADRHRLTTQERIELCVQVCEGVQHAHQKGVIHRDLKPSNILVALEAQDRPTPKIIDFGVAKATHQPLTDRTLYTEVGQLIGTPEYMSPEQAEMTGLDIDTRTDVYALGVVLYVLLTGCLPFDSRELRSAGMLQIQKHLREVDPPKPSTRFSTLGDNSTDLAKRRRAEPGALVRRLRGDLDWITMKALEKDRTRRYDSPIALAEDLARHLNNEPIEAGSPSAAYRTRKFVRRHKVGVTVTALLVAALTAGMIGTTLGFLRAKEAQLEALASRDEALKERDRAQQAKAESESVTDFLISLFEAADPNESRGKTVTASELLARGSQRIDDRFSDQPRVRAALMQVLGSVHTTLGSFDRADSLLSEALQIRSREFGESSAEVLSSLGALQSLALERATYPTMDRYARQALEVARALYGDEHPQIAVALTAVAQSASSLGNYDEALKLNSEALTMARSIQETSDEDLEVLVRRQANMLSDEQRYDEAEPLYLESLALSRRIFGEPSPRVAMAIDNLAIHHDTAGDTEKAERMYRQALAMLETVYGPEHPEVSQTLGNLAIFSLGKLQSAGTRNAELENEIESLLTRAAAIDERIRPLHPYYATNLASQALLAHFVGDFETALRQADKALEVFGHTYARRNDPFTVALRAFCLFNLGRYDDAESFLATHDEHLKTGLDEHSWFHLLQWKIKIATQRGQDDDARAYQAELAKLEVTAEDVVAIVAR